MQATKVLRNGMKSSFCKYQACSFCSVQRLLIRPSGTRTIQNGVYWNTALRNNVCVSTGCHTTSVLQCTQGARHNYPMSELYVQQRRHLSLDSIAYYYSPAFPPIHYAQEALLLAHNITGLPWWATIIVATVTLRTVITLPLSVYSLRNMAKIRLLGPEIAEKTQELKKEIGSAVKMYDWDFKQAKYHHIKNMKRIVRELYIRENCHPFKNTVVAWVQLPMWFSISLALRNMSGRSTFNSMAFDGAVQTDLATQGTLWFTNLMVPDTTLMLPLICGIVNLLIVEMNAVSVKNPPRLQRYTINMMRATSLIMIPIGAIVPSSMAFYWTCSSVYGLGQNIVFAYPSVKRVLGIPLMPNESDTPLADKWKQAKQKYRIKSSKAADSDSKQDK